MNIYLMLTYMHTDLSVPPASPHPYEVWRLMLVYSHMYTLFMIVIPLIHFFIALPLPLYHFPYPTEGSPLTAGVPCVSPLLPRLHILMKTYVPSFFVIPKGLKLENYSNICIPMFIAAQFTVAKLLNQPRCPSTDEWITKLWEIHTT